MNIALKLININYLRINCYLKTSQTCTAVIKANLSISKNNKQYETYLMAVLLKAKARDHTAS